VRSQRGKGKSFCNCKRKEETRSSSGRQKAWRMQQSSSKKKEENAPRWCESEYKKKRQEDPRLVFVAGKTSRSGFGEKGKDGIKRLLFREKGVENPSLFLLFGREINTGIFTSRLKEGKFAGLVRSLIGEKKTSRSSSSLHRKRKVRRKTFFKGTKRRGD